MKDYYEILGVEKNATKEDIKKAYRRLAHKYHPDKSGGDEARFKEVNEAYQILSSDEKRSQYDQFGRAGAGAGGQGGFDFSGFQGGFEGVDVGDIFETFFGRGASSGFGGFGGERGRRRGRDISIDVEIPFNESVFGTDRRVLIRKQAACDSCHGSGKEKDSKDIACTQCHGAGTIRDTKKSFLGTFTQVVECSVCHGRGSVPEKKCKTCKGEEVVIKSEEAHVIIPAGIENGEVIRISGKGEAAKGAEVGDLYAKVHVLPHPVFRRSGHDLLMPLELPLSDALVGGSREIETLDGKINIKIPQGVEYGEVLKVRGKGVPNNEHTRGDLLIGIKIKMPKKLSKTAKALIEQLKEEGN